MSRLLIIDNYDSFTFNLVYYFCELGIQPMVVKNDFAPTLTKKTREFIDSFEYLVISPGFGSPKDSGICMEILRVFGRYKKILGVCLGMQCIAQAFGGEIAQLPSPLHAQTALCNFLPNPLCKGISSPLKVGLYHSLFVKSLGECQLLGYIQFQNPQIPMILKHKALAIYGIQFHPESLLSKKGKKLLQNFLHI